MIIRPHFIMLCAAAAAACNGDTEVRAGDRAKASALGAETGVVTNATATDSRSAHFAPLGRMTSDVEILYGHPDSVGKPFVMRIRELPGTIVPPHTHPVDEHITIVQGTWYFGLGEQYDSTSLRELKAGSYAFAPAGATMFAHSPELAIVQVHGLGPFQIHWREQARVLDEPGGDRAFRYRKGEAVETRRGRGRIRQGYRSGNIIQYEVLLDNGTSIMASEQDVRVASGGT
jgi:quercetin dioxygenase-like cupin family protein